MPTKDNQTRILHGHTDGVASVAYSPDGQRIVSTSWDRSVNVWDVVKGSKILSVKGASDWVANGAFSPDGNHIASGRGGGGWDAQTGPLPGYVKVWDSFKGTEILSLKGHKDWVCCVAYSPDGTRIASGSGNSVVAGLAGEIKVWDARKGNRPALPQRPSRRCYQCCFQPRWQTHCQQ